MGFGVALVVVGGGSWWIYGFSGGGFVGFCVLEVVVVVCVWCWRGCRFDFFFFFFVIVGVCVVVRWWVVELLFLLWWLLER